MKLYIAGPMTGHEHFNYPAFNRAAAELREAGYTVLNPAENGEPGDHPDRAWSDWMRIALGQLIQADGVATLYGWSESKGAKVEVQLAEDLGIPVRNAIAWLNLAAIQHEIRTPLLGRQ